MPRILTIAGAQLGPIQKADNRNVVVARMIALMDQAKAKGADFVVYPELALTTFFPRWYHESRAEADMWFEREMPNTATKPLFDRAKAHAMGMTFGYAELTPDGHHFNTSIIVDTSGKIIGKYRKVHLPGHVEFDPERTHQHLEKRYFEPGDLGFPVWRTMGGIFGMMICNDRRWPEAYRVMGLQGVEVVTLGYNTPSYNSQKPAKDRSSGYSTTSCRCRPALIRTRPGSSPSVKPVARMAIRCSATASSSIRTARLSLKPRLKTDELIVHACDLDATRSARKRSLTSSATAASSTTA